MLLPGCSPPQADEENWSGVPPNPSWVKIFAAVPGRNGQSNTASTRQVSVRL